MKKIFFILAMFFTVQLFAQKPLEMLLWPNGAPNSNGLTSPEEDLEGGRVANVVNPSITVYRADKPNGMAIVACPGGGYVRLAMNHEGHDMADWFNAQGITYIVLKYRMPNGYHEVPRTDAEQAIRIVREHAKEWHINPEQVGIMGSSAGGHLAASVATLFSDESVRPNFQVLFYPVISMKPGITHAGSRAALITDDATAELEGKYCLEKQVSELTPPAFIMLSADDKAVIPQNSIDYFMALREKGVSATMHIYPIGGHGWGFRDSFIYKAQWTDELLKWLQQLY